MLGGLSLSDLSKGYEMIVDFIIRPDRLEYSADALNAGRQFRVQRTDLEITNKRGHKLMCSWYQPVVRPKERLPCVVYLHGNCGGRPCADEAMSTTLPYNITLFCFDFAGSGQSEGDYVSLGHYEKQDLEAVIEHLRKSETVSRIGLWGRSMGAATAVLFGVGDPSIAGMVVDSAFCSLKILAEELVTSQKEVKVPKMVYSMAMKAIRSSIKKKALFDIDDLTPIKSVGSCFIPVLFAHAEGDDFIAPHHSKRLLEKYAGDKNLILFEGDHNSHRPQFFFDSVTVFWHNTLLVGEDSDLAAAAASAAAAAPEPSTFLGASGGGGGSRYGGGHRGAPEDDDLQRALMLSMQSESVSVPLSPDATAPPDSGDEDEDLRRALELSMLESK